MPDNKVLFGLKNTHIAFQKTLLGKSIAITGPCTLTGSLTFIVTSAEVTGTPVSVTVALDSTTETTAELVATEIAAAVTANTAVAAKFTCTAEGAVVTVMGKDEYDADATFAVDITEATTGVTHGTPVDVDAIAFATPQPVNGSVGLNTDPEGEDYTFYADNGPYYSVTANIGYTGELEIALMPDATLVNLLGYEVDDNGMVLEVADGAQKPFALLTQFEGDAKNRKMIYYNCKASRPTVEKTTNEEGIEVSTETYPLVIQPIEISGKNVVKGHIELLNTPSAGNTAAYNNFFTVVQLPTFA